MNIKIHEVGLRDGLQNELSVVPFEKKVQWIHSIANSGVDIIQLGSFVHPGKVPQMADTDALFEYFTKKENKLKYVLLSGLVLNEKGMERAYKCNTEMLCMGVSASETHSMKNTGMTTADATSRIIKMAIQAIDDGKLVQVSVQSAFGCGFEGKIDENQVYEIVNKYLEADITNISLADTAGHAYPEQVKRMFTKIKQMRDDVNLTCHFHNTYGLGIANCYAAIESGVDCIETAFGGLGGCPFTKVAAGNVSTEDLIHSLQRNDIRTDIKLKPLIQLAMDAELFFEKKLEGVVYKTGGLK